MDDLKFKFLGLINKQNQSKVPSMGVNPELLNPIESINNEKKIIETSTNINDNETEQDILDSIELDYYKSDESFDSCRYELNKLSSTLNCHEIDIIYKKLEKQQQVVSTKVLQLILQKQNLCNDEFKKIIKIQEQLTNVVNICKMSRSDLSLAKKQFTTASLGILSNYKKRQILQELLFSLNTIKTLQKTDDRLQELLKEENFPGAISLLLECQSAAQTYKHFNCVAILASKLQDTLDQTEETLDNTICRLCTDFDDKTYTSVQEAYKLLRKSQTAIDQLHMHFTAAIHNSAFNIIYSHTGGDIKRQYNQLCQSVQHEYFINCLIDLSKGLWKILRSYNQVLNWHNNDLKINNNDNINEPEDTFNNHYITSKLKNGMSKIWHDIENKISIYLNIINIEKYRFEQFLHILSIVNRLIDIGNELCNIKSINLYNFMKKQSKIYFTHYHNLRLEELVIFFEHEAWELCPVKKNFTSIKLQEFKNLKTILINSHNEIINNDIIDDKLILSGWLEKYLNSDLCPFDISLDETMDESILEKSYDDGSGDYTDDTDDDIDIDINEKLYKKKKYYNGPIMTNTSLSILRVCGKYLQISNLLKTISSTVIYSIIQFFEFYFYSVHKLFTSDLQISSESLYTPKLKLTLARIKDNLFYNNNNNDNDNNNIEYKQGKIRQPIINNINYIDNDEKLYGLAERIIGVESIIELGKQYNNLENYLYNLIHQTDNNYDKELLNQFYSQTISSSIDLRKPIYMAVIEKCIDISKIINHMGKVNWEVKDVMSQHSEYVDIILKDIQDLQIKFNNIGSMTVDDNVKWSLWENVAHLINHTLVEGYSNAKKCSNGGRGLMQLDFTQLKTKFEMTTSVRPMPHSEYVEMYIKAYYISQSSIEEWLEKHKEYSVKHLSGLISCIFQNNKKNRQRLISLVEEQRSNR